jgi:hypothetical protein
MADEQNSTADETVAVLDGPGEKPEVFVAAPADEVKLEPAPDKKTKRKKEKEEEDELEREIEFVTPFGKIELEFEPTPKKQKKDQERRAKAAQRAADVAEKAQRKLVEQQAKAERGGRGSGRLLVILLVLALIGAAIAIAWWLFARPVEELDRVPEDLRVQPAPEPQGFVAKMRSRVREGIRAGQRASSETQREQMRRYEEVTGGGGK